MITKNFTIKIATLLALFGLLLPVANGARFIEGQHYIEIPFSDSLKTGKKVEVREFFWYGCPHCYRLEPLLGEWLKTKPKAALFVRTPAFLPKWKIHARLYYSLESLNKVDALHSKFFASVQNSKQKMSNKADIVSFVTSNGVNKADFLKAWDSFDVDKKIRKAQQLGQKYGIRSVPNMVVDGRYVIGAGSAGSQVKMMQVVDYLVNKIAKEKK
ncbi:MAG: thiol:disulfide interchange protein DsbA/DsbL [Acidiferrobacterales bacterium]